MNFLFQMFVLNSIMVFNFSSTCDYDSWFVTNDSVMGGVSNSVLGLDVYGNGVFSGKVSTKNNGGFTMMRLRKKINCKGFKNIKLRVKGDGKLYQFRLKPDRGVRFWYVCSFKAIKGWSEIVLDLKDFYPSFRGNKLNLPNFDSRFIDEFAILIANKKDEEFKLVIDYVKLN